MKGCLACAGTGTKADGSPCPICSSEKLEGLPVLTSIQANESHGDTCSGISVRFVC